MILIIFQAFKAVFLANKIDNFLIILKFKKYNKENTSESGAWHFFNSYDYENRHDYVGICL